MKTIALLSVCALMTVSGVALAQSATSEPKMAPPAKLWKVEAKTVPQQTMSQVLVSKLIGAEVMSPAKQKVGKIEYLVMNKDGRVEAAVIGVGGFLGIDRKDVALSFDSLAVNYGPKNDIQSVTANVTKDSLKAAPAYVYLDNKS